MADYIPFPKDGLPFVGMTARLGRAEFEFCLRYERGKLRRVFVTGRQQEEHHCYLFESPFPLADFHLSAYVDGDPRVWYGGWCKEHGGVLLRVYVPDEAAVLQLVPTSFGLGIEFRKGAR